MNFNEWCEKNGIQKDTWTWEPRKAVWDYQQEKIDSLIEKCITAYLVFDSKMDEIDELKRNLDSYWDFITESGDVDNYFRWATREEKETNGFK